MEPMQVTESHNTRNLYYQMEKKRETIPNISRDAYIPTFIIESIKDKLEASISADETIVKLISRFKLGKNILHTDTKNSSHAEDMSEDWTDNTLIEENLDFEGCYFFKDWSTRYAIEDLLDFTANCFSTFQVNEKKFMLLFAEEIEYPPLELLWAIDDVFHILSIKIYLLILRNETRRVYFFKQLLSFCFSPVILCDDNDNRDISADTLLQHFLTKIFDLAFIHRKSFASESNKTLVTMSQSFFNDLTDKLMSEDVLAVSSLNHRHIIETVKKLPVSVSLRETYVKTQLLHILTKDGTVSIPTERMQILQKQEQYGHPSRMQDNVRLTNTLNMLLSMSPSAKTVSSLLSTILLPEENPDLPHTNESHPPIHWERLLLMLTEWEKLKSFEAMSLVRELIKSLMSKGLSSECESKVLAAFILARHCSLIAPKVFARYEKWYTNMFESELYSPAKEPSTFRFLTNVLSKWVPVEPPCFLQVQATFWPFIPPSCRTLWSDYVALAKVRITEYNEIESAMELEPNPNNPLQHDVEMAIAAFKNTGKIPASINQMFMFRKQYYKESFLPALLKKPLGATLTDARLRLIEVLNRNGKIPPETYVTYKKQTSKEGSEDSPIVL